MMDPTECRHDDPNADDTHLGVKTASSSPIISHETCLAVGTNAASPTNLNTREGSASSSSALAPTSSELDVFAYLSGSQNVRSDYDLPKDQRESSCSLESAGSGIGGSVSDILTFDRKANMHSVLTDVQPRHCSTGGRDELIVGVEEKENQADFAVATDIPSAELVKNATAESLSSTLASTSAESLPQVGGQTYDAVSVQDQPNDATQDSALAGSQSTVEDHDQAQEASSRLAPRPVGSGETYYAVSLKLEESLQSTANDLPMDTDDASQSEPAKESAHEEIPSAETHVATTESNGHQGSCTPYSTPDAQQARSRPPAGDSADAVFSSNLPVSNPSAANAAVASSMDVDECFDVQSQSQPSTGGNTASTSSRPLPTVMDVDKEGEENGKEEEEENGEDDQGEEEDEEEDEGDDASSEVSDGEDLKGDLMEALPESSFTGSYAYASSLPDAPNPCLDITELGPVGLPLSPRDAGHLIAAAAQAPFGHGTETVVNTKVRDTWEINADRVKFNNPMWEEYIQKTLVKNVAQALGVNVNNSRMPRAELYKLLVYEQGSHFLPHQDTVKTPGMFATIIIVLPSQYTGGQVHVSHASSSQVFDFASTSNPLLTTCVLAWYTDVTHEVKPVTSGHRLALSYNLVHVTPGVPLPALPDEYDKQVAALRGVLRKWRKGGYEGSYSHSGVLAHILNHQYSQASLSQGARALKGTDAHLVACLMPVAKEQGFFVGLASLECHQIGDAGEDDFGGCYYKRRRGYGGWSSDEDYDDYYGYDKGCPSMGEVQDTTIKVNNLVDMDGNKPIGDNELPIGEEELIEDTHFEDADPDKREYEGYMGNYAGSVEHWYKRTVLVLMPSDDADSILLRAGGVTYALDKLRASQAAQPNRPSEDDLRLADMVVRNMSANSVAICTTMARYAISWNNLDLWRRVLRVCTLSTLSVDELVKGWRVFTFPSVRTSFEDMIARSGKLAESVEFVQALTSRASPGAEQEVVQGWQRYVVGGFLSTLKAPTVEDVPVLLNVAKTKGAQHILHTFVPQLEGNAKLHKFWVAFMKALQNDETAILLAETSVETLSKAESTSPTSRVKYERLLRRCLEIIVKHWETDLPSDSNPAQRNIVTHSYYGAPAVPSVSPYDRVVEILDLALDVEALDQAKNFLALVCKSKTPAENFPKLYTPLISHIRQRLSRKDSNVFSPPFTEFMQLMVASVKTPTNDDIPWLMEVLRLKGIPYFLNSFIPQVEKDRTLYSFWLAFLKTFQTERSKITLPADNIQDQIKTFSELCLNFTIASWSHGLPMTGSRSYIASVPTPQSRVMELVELCISMGVLDSCKRLFSQLIARIPVTEESIRTIYNPLIPQLRQHLRQKGTDILSHPFLDFIQVLIGTYLRNVLGARPKIVATSRKVGCGCADCNELDRFMMSTHAEHSFRYVLQRRNHLEQRLLRARDIVTTDTIRRGSPHALVVKKVPSVMASCSWMSRQKQAKDFLNNIGSDDLIAKIAGPRYGDILKALAGTQQFTLPWNTTAGGSSAPGPSSVMNNTLTARRGSSAVNPTPAGPSSIPSNSIAPSMPAQHMTAVVPASSYIAPPAPSGQPTRSAVAARLPVASSSSAQSAASIATAGTKRKKAPLSSTIIDLTEEDSS